MDSSTVLQSGIAAALFAAIFLAGARLHPLRAWFPDRRTTVSFSAGMSTAYVFVHVMPELQGARGALAESVSARLPYEGMAIYVFALVGFMLFYGLEHLRARAASDRSANAPRQAFRIHVGGFAAFVLLVSYLLLDPLEHSPARIVAYTVAMACHFLAVDHSLAQEHGALFDRTGRFVLAGASLVGWGLGLLAALPPYVLALVLAFVSGAVIVNSAVSELPSGKDGRFWPYLAGAFVYTLLLLPLA